jgi:hypothetical protein
LAKKSDVPLINQVPLNLTFLTLLKVGLLGPMGLPDKVPSMLKKSICPDLLGSVFSMVAESFGFPWVLVPLTSDDIIWYHADDKMPQGILFKSSTDM